MTPARPWTSSLAGLVIGAVAIALVTAMLTGAVASVRADNRTNTLTSQVGGLRLDNKALRADNTALRAQVGTLAADNKALRRQVTGLVTYLKSRGLDIPKALTPRPGSATSPKGPTSSGASPSHSPTPSPRPTTGTPSPGGISAALLCDLLNLSPCPLP